MSSFILCLLSIHLLVQSASGLSSAPPVERFVKSLLKGRSRASRKSIELLQDPEEELYIFAMSPECEASLDFEAEILHAEEHYYDHVMSECFELTGGAPIFDEEGRASFVCEEGKQEYQDLCQNMMGAFCDLSLDFRVNVNVGTVGDEEGLEGHTESLEFYIVLYQCLPIECDNDFDKAAIELDWETVLEANVEPDADNGMDLEWLCTPNEIVIPCDSDEPCGAHQYCMGDHMCADGCLCEKNDDTVEGNGCLCERCSTETVDTCAAMADQQGLEKGTVAAIAVGGVSFFGGVGFIIFCFMQRRNRFLAKELKKERLPPRTFIPMDGEDEFEEDEIDGRVNVIGPEDE